MTTGIWSRKHMTLGADRLSGGTLTVQKLFKLKNGAFLIGAGFMDDLIEVAHWINTGCNEDAKPALADRDTDKDSDFILVEPDGKAYWLTCPFLRKVEILDDFLCIGTGDKFALGALAAGATVEQALAIAAKYDEATGAEFDVVKIKPKGKVK